jgi:xanthine dehydrogenase accessory factor
MIPPGPGGPHLGTGKLAPSDIYTELQQSLDAQRPLAYCRLVATYGSTPQKAGAIMLVFADGAQAGSLGGGCMEAEVRRTALQTIVDGRARVVTMPLDHDYGWDDGLICGGRVTVLIRPVEPSSPAARYYQQLCHVQRQGQGTEVVVFDGQAAGLPEADCFLCDKSGHLVDALSAAPVLPNAVQQQLQPLSARPPAYVAQGMACLPWLSHCRLVIVGGGHVGRAVADLASQLEFDVWVVDDREEYVTAERFPHASRRIAGSLDDVLPALDVTPDTYCLIMTRGHAHDTRALYHLIDRPARYVGMIGSRRKIELTFADLVQEGIAEESLRRVYAPVGIDIGSRTVPEIAVSICAELIAHRNCNGLVPGRPPHGDVSPEQTGRGDSTSLP